MAGFLSAKESAKMGLGVVAVLAGGVAAVNLAMPAQCSEAPPPNPAHWPFWFKGVFNCHDVPSLRRGWEVYRQVCASCHSIRMVSFRHLHIFGVYPLKRVKQIAREFDVEDGPNDEGDMYLRPGESNDKIPGPYNNDEAARYANGGSLPPDLSQYCAGCERGADYIFSLLALGYRETPEGIHLQPGLYYNMYFHGGAIAMPPPLLEAGQVDYEDGTPATVSQMSKDVTQFLSWSAEKTHDERKLLGLKMIVLLVISNFTMAMLYRTAWIGYKTRRIDFYTPSKCPGAHTNQAPGSHPYPHWIPTGHGGVH